MGVGVALMGLRRPELVMKSIVPVVMAGVLRIYGLIISTGINPKAKPYFLFDGYAHLTSGLACGLAGLAAGMSIGIVGDAGVRFLLGGPSLDVSLTLLVSLGGPRRGGRRGRHWSLARQQHQYLAAVGNGRELFHAPNPGRKSPSACTPSPWACSWRCCPASTCPGAPLPPPSRSSSSTSRTPAPALRSLYLKLWVNDGDFVLLGCIGTPIIERTDATAARSSRMCASKAHHGHHPPPHSGKKSSMLKNITFVELVKYCI